MDATIRAESPPRLRSLDAYRGFVMLAMASGGLGLVQVAGDRFDLGWLDQVAGQFDHVPWRGCVFWDLIQPSFMFIVGAAMPFSYAARRARGEPPGRLFGHALVRSAILVALGVFLASAWSPRTNFLFTNVLAQIGLGYPLVFLLLGRSPRVQAGALAAILVGYWALFAAYPLPTSEQEYIRAGLPMNWHYLEGFQSHWEKNLNAAAAFDRWFLNLFPQPDGTPYLRNDGGYATLNFVPSIATMLIGVLAGRWLRAEQPGRVKVVGLAIAGVALLAVGALLDDTICPIVKRIWTPSWVLFSSAWTCWLLAAFYGIIDVAGWRSWTFPLVVVGMNSIAMYMMAQLMKGWVAGQLKIHLGTLFAWLRDRFGAPLNPDIYAGPYGPIVRSVLVLGVLWLICLWLYRRRIFFKI